MKKKWKGKNFSLKQVMTRLMPSFSSRVWLTAHLKGELHGYIFGENRVNWKIAIQGHPTTV